MHNANIPRLSIGRRRTGRGIASVKGKKFEHFARFEAQFERKVLRAAEHLHRSIVAANNKGEPDPG